MRLPDLQEYIRLTREEKVSLCRVVAKSHPGVFYFSGPGDGEDVLPTFVHMRTGLPCKVVVGGTFEMGCSEAEERAARAIQNPPPITFDELRPVHTERVAPFMVSVSPVLMGEYTTLNEDLQIDREGSWPGRPVSVSYSNATLFSKRLGFRLPREAEWEYACRGGTVTLFPWGDRLLPESELMHWLDNNFAGNMPRTANRFGLKGLFTGEWCTDEYRPNYSPSTKPLTSVQVVRGGGSVFWPWQGAGEWVWCMSSIRMPSTDLPPERTSGFRLVRELSGS